MTDTKREIEELIERLERATGQDRELDRDIHWIGAMRMEADQ